MTITTERAQEIVAFYTHPTELTSKEFDAIEIATDEEKVAAFQYYLDAKALPDKWREEDAAREDDDIWRDANDCADELDALSE